EIGLGPEPRRLEERAPPVARVVEGRGARPEVERAAVPLRRDAHVLEHGEVREDVRELVGLGDPEARDRVLREPRDVAPAEPDAARARRHLAGDQLEECRLARAVRPDDGAQLALVHREAHAIDREEAAVAPRQLHGAQQGGAGHQRVSITRAFGVSRRAPPCYLPAMFPLPPLTDEQRAIIERAAALARERFAPRAARHDAEASFPYENYADLRRAGLLALTVPQE